MNEYVIKYTLYNNQPKDPEEEILVGTQISTEDLCVIVEAEKGQEAIDSLIEDNEFKISVKDINKL